MKPELEAEIRSFFPTPHKAMGYLATVDSCNGFTPEVRPMTLMELDWYFYFATTTHTRKTREMATHPKVSALVMFKKDAFSGYLRIVGRVEQVPDVMERKRVASIASFQAVLECRWKGAEDPDLAFVCIIPERIEYMRPGEDDAKDITADILRVMGKKRDGKV